MGQNQRFTWARSLAPFRRSEKCFWVESEFEENREKLSLLSKSLKPRRARLTLLCIEIIFLTRFLHIIFAGKPIFQEKFLFDLLLWFSQICFEAQHLKGSTHATFGNSIENWNWIRKWIFFHVLTGNFNFNDSEWVD